MEKLCAAALAVTMAMGNLTYGAPLENGRASARALSAAKIEGLYQDIMDESGTEELLKDGLVMHPPSMRAALQQVRSRMLQETENNGTVVEHPHMRREYAEMPSHWTMEKQQDWGIRRPNST